MDDQKLQQVKELKAKGLKHKEIAKELGVSVGTIDRAVAKLRRMEAEQNPQKQSISEERLREIIREELEEQKEGGSKLPAVLKTGKGQEVISPEGIMEFYLLGDGDAGAAMLKGMMLLRAAQLMVLTDVEIMKGQADAQAAAIKPILDIMTKAREDMDAAAERARASTTEAAEAAAAGAAARAVMHIDDKFDQLMKQKVDIATVQDPMRGLMARTMESMMTRMEAMFFGGQVGPTPGMVDKRK